MQQRLRRGSIAWLGAALLVGALILPVPAAADDAFTTWTGGPGAGGDNTYTGFIDLPPANAPVPNGSFVVSGWFVDQSAQGWAGADDVEVFQGTMDGGGKLLTKALFAQGRPDVAAALGNPFWGAAGFNATVPSGSLSPGAQALTVYAHTPGKGWWYKQVAVNVSSAAAAPAPAPSVAAPAPGVHGASAPIVAFEKPKDGEAVPTHNDYEMIGYALDTGAAPNQGVAGSGIDRVQVYIGRDTGFDRDHGAIFLGEAELGFNDSTPAQYGGQFASSGWRLTFKPTSLHANTYILFAYARSALSGNEEVAQRFFAIRE